MGNICGDLTCQMFPINLLTLTSSQQLDILQLSAELVVACDF